MSYYHELEREYAELKTEKAKLAEEVDIQRASIQELSKQLVAMTEEKERCRKLAVKYSLKADEFEIRFNRCENMKLAHEFEDLLQTTSIPVAVEKLRELLVIKEVVKELVLFDDQVGLDNKG